VTQAPVEQLDVVSALNKTPVAAPCVLILRTEGPGSVSVVGAASGACFEQVSKFGESFAELRAKPAFDARAEPT
jgi:hypothetical protein